MKQMCVRVPPTIAQMDWQPSIRVFRPTLLSDTIEESLKQEMSLLQLLHKVCSSGATPFTVSEIVMSDVDDVGGNVRPSTQLYD